jgi:V/A-type H+-transporting ATPase subunit F
VRIAVLASPATAAGWRLAGLDAIEAEAGDAGTAALDALLDATDLGVVLVEQPLYDGLAAEARAALARRPLPMVVPYPAPSPQPGGGGADAVIAELLRQAIGYRVRLR